MTDFERSSQQEEGRSKGSERACFEVGRTTTTVPQCRMCALAWLACVERKNGGKRTKRAFLTLCLFVYMTTRWDQIGRDGMGHTRTHAHTQGQAEIERIRPSCVSMLPI